MTATLSPDRLATVRARANALAVACAALAEGVRGWTADEPTLGALAELAASLAVDLSGEVPE